MEIFCIVSMRERCFGHRVGWRLDLRAVGPKMHLLCFCFVELLVHPSPPAVAPTLQLQYGAQPLRVGVCCRLRHFRYRLAVFGRTFLFSRISLEIMGLG